MKTIATTFLMLISCLILGQSQDIPNQTTESAKLQLGNYTAYLTHKNASNYLGGIEELQYELTEVKEYRLNPGTHKEVYLAYDRDPNRPDETRPAMLVPDNEAFPVTYISSSYEGNKKLQQEIGYTIRKMGNYGKTRFVFLDGKIYYINDWKDKDNYTLKAVLEYTEKPLKGFKLIKEVYKTRKKMNTEQPDKVLQEYLDKATAKQVELHAQWLKEPKNVSYIAEQKRVAKAMEDYIVQDKKDYYNSEEYKRIMENNARADRAQSASKVTVLNNTGNTVYIRSDSSGGWTRVSSGSTTTVWCDKDIYYNTEGKGRGTMFCPANRATCGSTVNVQ